MSAPDLTALPDSALAEKLSRLPSLPKIVAQLVGLDPTTETYFEEILTLLESEPPFAARLMRLANSSAISPNGGVNSLREALSRVGTRRVRTLILSAAVTEVFVPTNEGQRDLWIHSIQAATSARAFAGLPGQGEVDPEVAFVAGLLHDIGRFLMFHESPKSLNDVNETQWETPEELVRVEQQLCGFDHAELGWRACHAWGLPEEIASIVRHHHSVATGGSCVAMARANPTLAVVAFADAVSVKMMKDPDWAELDDDRKLDRLDVVCARHLAAGLNSGQVLGLEARIREESEATAIALGLLAG